MEAQALTGKVKFAVNDKVQYRVETILNGSKSGWKQHFNTKEKAMEFIKNERDRYEFCGTTAGMSIQFLVTEVTTKTMGLF